MPAGRALDRGSLPHAVRVAWQLTPTVVPCSQSVLMVAAWPQGGIPLSWQQATKLLTVSSGSRQSCSQVAGRSGRLAATRGGVGGRPRGVGPVIDDALHDDCRGQALHAG